MPAGMNRGAASTKNSSMSRRCKACHDKHAARMQPCMANRLSHSSGAAGPERQLLVPCLSPVATLPTLHTCSRFPFPTPAAPSSRVHPPPCPTPTAHSPHSPLSGCSLCSGVNTPSLPPAPLPLPSLLATLLAPCAPPAADRLPLLAPRLAGVADPIGLICTTTTVSV